MTQIRPRGAVAPLRRPAASFRRPTVDAVVAALRPEEPLHCLRPAAVTAAARAFVAAFPGDVLYAVKCNAEPTMLRAIAAGGVAHFDCASEAEVRLVRSLFPDAAIHFMHPVKSRGAIRAAWAQHGVRDFVLDTDGELTKILQETGGGAGELGLVVRLALPKGSAAYDLSGKFGAAPAEAAALLRAARPHAARLGLSFHVGSQCLDPAAWTRAIALAAEVIAAAGVAIEVVDVGGGFPVAYPGSEPPALSAFMEAIRAGAALLPPGVRLWAEPGRALVAGGASVVVQVQARRGDSLYVNDGVYGALSDAGAPGFRFPHRLIRGGEPASDVTRAFTLFGPTCDSADVMRGPWELPADVREGDWIEIGQLGAYGTALRTAFNGFDRAHVTEVSDSPMLATPGYEASAPARAA
ncbi:type III PLP-dependent enzyme [Roseomonas eburnea]|uniref:ornithine decarboxylase n=1 Tax=Neoroseomonas eburnea TaxID=1346889 RepID=A0A9X9XCB4_9PROT|nr:type III PLP-dependent enzyme [Neoroseomonas eburnea]MBR0681350.1 type III PLP-dependent enzyme [Neoroseomonas eburnea]